MRDGGEGEGCLWKSGGGEDGVKQEVIHMHIYVWFRQKLTDA